MGRSGDYLRGAELVIYFDGAFLTGEDENGEYCQDIAELNWDDFYYNIKAEIKARFKSYNECDKWDGRETKIFLENELAEIGLSEYCGLCSLSVRAKDNFNDYYSYAKDLNGFAQRHVSQIENGLIKCLENAGVTILNRLGTFSNGCGVFEKANA